MLRIYQVENNLDLMIKNLPEISHFFEMFYENGWIDSKLSFAETKRLHYIYQYVQDDIDSSDYSRKIRPHINKE